MRRPRPDPVFSIAWKAINPAVGGLAIDRRQASVPELLMGHRKTPANEHAQETSHTLSVSNHRQPTGGRFRYPYWLHVTRAKWIPYLYNTARGDVVGAASVRSEQQSGVPTLATVVVGAGARDFLALRVVDAANRGIWQRPGTGRRALEVDPVGPPRQELDLEPVHVATVKSGTRRPDHAADRSAHRDRPRGDGSVRVVVAGALLLAYQPVEKGAIDRVSLDGET